MRMRVLALALVMGLAWGAPAKQAPHKWLLKDGPKLDGFKDIAQDRIAMDPAIIPKVEDMIQERGFPPCDRPSPWVRPKCNISQENCAHRGVFSWSECKCICASNWQGPFCEECLSDGICVHGVYNETKCGCKCNLHWKGDKCDICGLDSTKCVHGQMSPTTCKCEPCPPGWSGDWCEISLDHSPQKLGPNQANQSQLTAANKSAVNTSAIAPALDASLGSSTSASAIAPTADQCSKFVISLSFPACYAEMVEWVIFQSVNQTYSKGNPTTKCKNDSHPLDVELDEELLLADAKGGPYTGNGTETATHTEQVCLWKGLYHFRTKGNWHGGSYSVYNAMASKEPILGPIVIEDSKMTYEEFMV